MDEGFDPIGKPSWDGHRSVLACSSGVELDDERDHLSPDAHSHSGQQAIPEFISVRMVGEVEADDPEPEHERECEALRHQRPANEGPVPRPRGPQDDEDGLTERRWPHEEHLHHARPSRMVWRMVSVQWLWSLRARMVK